MNDERSYPASMRQDYTQGFLEQSDLARSPFDQFAHWFANAAAGPNEANAMTLATVSATGRPSARIVLLKGFDENGFVFFTNQESAKGIDLAQNPFCSLVFWWPHLERQVRIEGRASKMPLLETEEYFQSRPRGSQIGAWASPQSRPIERREFLERRVDEMEKRFEGIEKLPLPPFWGGYRVEPDRFEFWQGRRSRLHDRFSYEKTENGEWLVSRLAP